MGLDRHVRAEAQRLTARRLDLDDVGPELREQQPAVGPVVDLTELDDPDAVEGESHDGLDSRSGLDDAGGAAVDVADGSDALLPPRRFRSKYWMATASVSEWNVPSSLKLTWAPCIHHRTTVSSVLSSGVKKVCVVPAGSKRYDPATWG